MKAKVKLPGCTLTEEDFNRAIDIFIEKNRDKLYEEFEDAFDFWGEDLDAFLDTKRSKALEPLSEDEDSDEQDVYDEPVTGETNMFRRAYHHKEIDEFGLWVYYTKDQVVQIEPEYW